MNEDTKQALADICAIPGKFEKLVIRAKDEVLDAQIDELDFLMRRGQYKRLRHAPLSHYEKARQQAIFERSK